MPERGHPPLLEEEHEALLHYLYHAPIGLIQSDREGEITTINRAASSILTPIMGDVGLSNIAAIFERIWPSAGRLIAEFQAERGLICDKTRSRIDAAEQGGRDHVVEISLYRLSPDRLVTAIEDVTETAAAELTAMRKEAEAQALSAILSDSMIYRLDASGRLDQWRRAGDRMSEIAEADVLGATFQEMLDRFYEDEPSAEMILNGAEKLGRYDFESWVQGEGDIRLWCANSVVALRSLSGELDGFIVISRDLSDHRAYEVNLRRIAETDGLTGAPNRRAFLQALAAAAREARARREDLALAMLDIDHFKEINDVFGHSAGDEALRNLVSCANDSLRSGDLFGRLDGEEFGMLLRGARRDRANALLERIRAMIEDHAMTFEGRDISFTVSIGLAFLDVDGGETDEALMVRASNALRAAKERGRNQISLAA